MGPCWGRVGVHMGPCWGRVVLGVHMGPWVLAEGGGSRGSLLREGWEEGGGSHGSCWGRVGVPLVPAGGGWGVHMGPCWGGWGSANPGVEEGSFLQSLHRLQSTAEEGEQHSFAERLGNSKGNPEQLDTLNQASEEKDPHPAPPARGGAEHKTWLQQGIQAGMRPLFRALSKSEKVLAGPFREVPASERPQARRKQWG